ncbi:MAG: hypothetical protein R2711_17190 [Acidimicrobiales bacterium]
MLALTVEYLGDRFSFGRPLSSYQALKRRVADQKVWLEASRDRHGGGPGGGYRRDRRRRRAGERRQALDRAPRHRARARGLSLHRSISA